MSRQPKRYARLEVFPGRRHQTSTYGPDYLDGSYYVRLRARNGRILLTSESYATKANAWRLARLVRAMTFNTVYIREVQR